MIHIITDRKLRELLKDKWQRGIEAGQQWENARIRAQGKGCILAGYDIMKEAEKMLDKRR